MGTNSHSLGHADWPSGTGLYTAAQAGLLQGMRMTKFTKAVVGFAALAAMAGSQALAAGPELSLAPGKPAGVQQAQRHHRTNLLLIGGVTAVVAAGIVVAVANGNNSSCSAANCPSTTATPSTS